jgi:hypothetical protein
MEEVRLELRSSTYFRIYTNGGEPEPRLDLEQGIYQGILPLSRVAFSTLGT